MPRSPSRTTLICSQFSPQGAASAERAAPHADLALSKCSDRDFCLGCALTSATAVQFGVPFQNVSLVAFFTEP